VTADPASFRDPSGRVYVKDGRVLRAVSEAALADFETVRANPVLARLVDEGRVIASADAANTNIAAAKVVEHRRLPFISYPYEWSFPLLKAAALHHLDLQLALLPAGVSLSDASAYNVQFEGPRPIFIDALSFRPYTDGEYWTGHRQFCEQFLNPLLLQALSGVAHNEWLRGSLEGVSAQALARLIPWRRRFSLRIAAHVLIPAKLASARASEGKAKAALARPLSRSAYLGLLSGLRDWISGLKPLGARTAWSDYADNNSYGGEEARAKHAVIARFAERARPKLLLDLGCNSGAYAETALVGGARSVVGFDADHGALARAYARAVAKQIEFLPLYQDAANPSPAQGFGERERQSLSERAAGADALIALALVHHLAIGRNIPLDRLVDWLLSLASQGVVEFVPKSDPMTQRLLALRKDVFADYSIEAFGALLAARARIVETRPITDAGRTLFVYDRRGR
jgi:ribosomal protein L11 methylase PrmA